MAGLGLVIVNALSESSRGLFMIASTIPIAVFMVVWIYFLGHARFLANIKRQGAVYLRNEKYFINGIVTNRRFRNQV